ncbi:MAG TPA: hypothetical protein DCY37_00295 [Acidaminococcaceae bacterium]|nr:hypothetical protein [Acidaminococcaceae bacterium]
MGDNPYFTDRERKCMHMSGKSGAAAAWLELIGKSRLQTFQDNFAKAFNVAVNIHDLNGQPLTVWAQRPLFCFAIRQEHREQCDANFREDLERVREGETFIHVCPFGIARMYIPILFQNKPVAYAVVSGVTYPEGMISPALREKYHVTVHTREEAQNLLRFLDSALRLLNFNLPALRGLDRFAPSGEDARDTSQPRRDNRISRREMDIVRLICKGMSNKQIGTALAISETTVKTHISNILAKLNLHDRTQIAMHFYEKGLNDTQAEDAKG